MKKVFILFSLFILTAQVYGQSDEEMLESIYKEALGKGRSYEMLEYLSKKIGNRLSGSPKAAAAVEWTKQMMESFGFDTVFLQPVMVPHWVRGETEIGRIVNSKAGIKEVNICALGNSIGTGPGGIKAQVIEVRDFNELENLGENKVSGKIVFYNRPMDPTLMNTFAAYGGAVNQRGQGASRAAKLGAVGVVVRSMTLTEDEVPHTGAMSYAADIERIPAIAISTNDANLLSSLLQEDPELEFFFETHCQMMDEVLSYNVIGELQGQLDPKEYVVVGGHLDSWDVGEGAHDDGAGCVQSIEALRILQQLGIKPKYTLRAVMFMNEENGLRGGLKYAEVAKEQNENHIAAIESDRGGFVPRGFSISTSNGNLDKILGWSRFFIPYEADRFFIGGGGADIGPLRSQNTTLIGLYPDSQRYFTYHHTKIDTFDKVNKRELELGAAAMASMIYLIDKYGLEKVVSKD